METNSIQQNPNPKISSIDTNLTDKSPKNSSIDTYTIDQSPKTSLIDNQSVDRNPSPKTDTNSIEKNTSIDHSLGSISEISRNSSNNSINDELYSDAPIRLAGLDDSNTPIGLTNDNNNDDISALNGMKNDDNVVLESGDTIHDPNKAPSDDVNNALSKLPIDANNNELSGSPSGLTSNHNVALESADTIHDANKAPRELQDDEKKGLSELANDDDDNVALKSGDNNDVISASRELQDDEKKRFSGLPSDVDNKGLSELANDDDDDNVALKSGDNNDVISASRELQDDEKKRFSGLPSDVDNKGLSELANDDDDDNVALKSGDNNDVISAPRELQDDEKKGHSGLPSDVDNKGLSELANDDDDDDVALKSGDRVMSQSSLGGYERERESSGGSTSGIEGGDEISEVGVVDGSGEPAVWVPGKRHVHEDDGSVSWRKRKKHFFILSHSGKPIYSRYGDEHKLAGFSATLQAIVSFVEDGKDRIQLVRAGKHQVVFLVKGPIYLVCISCTEEPYESLRAQLELVYGQMIVILTQSVNRCFEKNSKFDMTPLLGGTDVVFSSLIHSFSWNPATFLHAYTCLPLAYATRQAAGAILQDVADSGVLFAILMCKHKVVSLVGAQKASLHPDDMLLLSNFVMSSESFRTSESFSPICLPRYNPMAFLYAYVQYLDVDTYLMLLTTSSDAFYHLKECRILIENVLLKSNVLSEVQRSMLDGGMHVEDVPLDTSSRSSSPQFGQPKLVTDSIDRISEGFVGVGGPSGLWHFIYRSIYLNQYVSSEFSSPINSSRQQKRLYRAYQNLFSSMHEKDVGPHKTQFRRDEHFVLLCWVTLDFELYAAFDPLADKALAIKTCNRVCQWVKDVENEIFLLGASPFSW